MLSKNSLIDLRRRLWNREIFFSQVHLFLLVLIFQPGLCSRAVLHAQPLNLKFNRLTMAQGLSQSAGLCLLQDRQGFLWIGTAAGLDKYDGYGFTAYKHVATDSTSISTGWVTTLFEDRDGMLWVGTNDGGLNHFDPATERFAHFVHDPRNPHSLSTNQVTAIYEDHLGALWVGTNQGLNKFDRSTQTFTCFMPDPQNPRSLSIKYVTSVFEDSAARNTLWIGTEGGGLNRFDRDTESFTHFLHDPADTHSLSSNHVTAIYEDHLGALWIGTGGAGLNRFDRGTQTFTRFVHNPKNPSSLSDNFIQTICEDSHRTGLWIGTRSSGLNRFDAETGEFTRYTEDPGNPHSLSSNRVWSICEDRSGALWVGTENGGLNKWDPGQERFTSLKNELENSQNSFHNQIWSIGKDRFGALWIGTSNGLFRRTRDDRGKERLTYFASAPQKSHTLSDNEVYVIFEDQQGTLWIGTGKGLDQFDRNKARFIRWADDALNPSGLARRQIFSICEDPTSPRTLWIGTDGGLFRLIRDANGQNQITVFKHDPQNPNSISDNGIRPLCIDRAGTLWVGTRYGGLNQFDRENERFIRFVHDPKNPHSLSNDVIRSIYEDQAGRLWIGTDGGLNQFDPDPPSNNINGKSGQFRSYTERDGLPNNAVWGILEDDRGRLWLSTNNGLSCFDPQNQKFKNYFVRDGLAHPEFNRGAYFKSDDGTMFFGGINGVTKFHPDSVKDNPFIPPVVITAFKRYNTDAAEGGATVEKGISVKQEIELSYKDNIISFEFAALSFRNPEKNQYAYKLEGYRDHWIQLGAKREATFTNLDPGEYVLRVKGSNNDGVWNEEGASLRIIIAPPWWKTWWAYTFYVSLLMILLLAARRYELNRLQLKNRLRIEQVEAEKLREVDQTKSRFFANISHEFRTPLTLILGQIDSVLATIADKRDQSRLEIASRNARRLQRLINQLLDLSKLEAGSMALKAVRTNLVSFLKNLAASFEHLAEQKLITLQFHSTHEEIVFDYDPEKLEKVFYNLLSNAFKFTPEGGKVEVAVAVGSEQRAEGLEQRAEAAALRPPPSALCSFIEITIRDTGIGIPAEHLPHVFDRFYQADSSHQHEGTGIGLALAKELVELHHGEISVTSEAGKGTELVVKLPLPAYSNQLSVIRDRKVDDRELKIEDRESMIADSTLQDFATPSPQQSNEELVLLVEDNADIRAYVREQLERGYRVIEATDGEEGLAQAREAIPDLIITDVMMPKMDGYQMSRILKHDEKTSHIPIIMLTAKAALDDKIAGLETGVDDYLLKPFSTKELLVRVRNLITQRRELRRRFSTATVIKPTEVAATSVDQAFLQRVITAIEAHISDEHYGVEELATAVNMSCSQVNRKLGALIDQPASQLIRSMRLQRAADLLKQNAGTVAEIAYQTGFSDQAHFARSFKKQFGCAPSEFRENL